MSYHYSERSVLHVYMTGQVRTRTYLPSVDRDAEYLRLLLFGLLCHQHLALSLDAGRLLLSLSLGLGLSLSMSLGLGLSLSMGLSLSLSLGLSRSLSLSLRLSLWMSLGLGLSLGQLSLSLSLGLGLGLSLGLGLRLLLLLLQQHGLHLQLVLRAGDLLLHLQLPKPKQHLVGHRLQLQRLPVGLLLQLNAVCQQRRCRQQLWRVVRLPHARMVPE